MAIRPVCQFSGPGLEDNAVESCPPNSRLRASAQADAKGEPPMSFERHVKLFTNGRNQAVRIPGEFELPGEDAIIRRKETA